MTRRTKRKRAHIPLREKLASALADKLPQIERDALRKAKVPAATIISMFTPDHVVLHALDGVDDWHNLTMERRGPELKAKDNRDTGIVAKSDRLVDAEQAHRNRMARDLVDRVAGMPTPVPPDRVRRIPNRGFAKGHRPLRGRKFQRRQS